MESAGAGATAPPREGRESLPPTPAAWYPACTPSVSTRRSYPAKEDHHGIATPPPPGATEPRTGARPTRWSSEHAGSRPSALPLPLAIAVALLAPMLFLGVVLFMPQPARGAAPDFIVDSLLDEPDAAIFDGVCRSAPSGKCTLRAATQQAELSATATIGLPAGTYVLTRGQIDIKVAITIEGAGAASTIIDGNGSDPACYPATARSCRIFDMKIGSSLTASGLTVRNGKAGLGELSHFHGGAIHNHGSLVLKNVVVRDSIVPEPGWGGGGITNANGASADLENVTISGNRAKVNGGGIENLGGLSVRVSTISGNSAEAKGGGIWHNSTAFSAIRYVTIAGNVAPVGGGGGINRGGGVALNVTDTIVSGNLAANCVGVLASLGYNLSSDPSCAFTDPTDKNSTDPKLGPLQDNGGGLPTHRPGPTSPAIDARTAGCGGTDQRGVARPQGAGCDSGAVELKVFTLSLAPGGGAATGGGAFREEAVASLQAAPTAAQVFTGWTIDGTFQGWANPLTITMNANHSVVAAFAPRQTFGDATPSLTGSTEAIAQLAARGIIKGCDPAAALFCPTDPTLRAQMAALIVRALGWGGETPTNPFTDRDGVDDELWQAIAILADHGVAKGYGGGQYGTTDPVLNAQVISFITRAMVNKGHWSFQPDNGTLYPNVPPGSGHRQDLATYVHYAGVVRGTAGATAPFDGWDQASSRAYFAFALWQALDSYFSVDRVP